MSEAKVTVFHNPNCGTSRNTVNLVREAGIEPEVVEYLKAGWTADQLKDLFGTMGVSPRDVLRERGTDAQERGLTRPSASDEEVITAMVENPILVNRPIVVSEMGAALCRPAEKAAELLPPGARERLIEKGLVTP
jgi:arsenate reductase